MVLKGVDFQALFQDEGGGQDQGPGRGGEQIVHRARHRQPADVAAGKEEGVHHEGIGGEGQPVGTQKDGGAVVAEHGPGSPYRARKTSSMSAVISRPPAP